MRLIDTHAHLDADAFADDVAAVIDQAVEAGVEQILTIGIDLKTSQNAVKLAREFERVFAVVGIQPNYASAAHLTDMATIEAMLEDPRVVAIGETGLDRYWDYAPLDLQREFFDQHLDLAARHQMPFIVHCRDAETEVVAQLKSFAGSQPLVGVMHSFCGSAETATACLDLGLHLSFSGMVTYKKNTELRDVARTVPLERLLIETDAPYLVPTPLRGKQKRNEPAYVQHTAAVLAEVHGLTPAEMGQATTDNARRLFGLPAVEQ